MTKITPELEKVAKAIQATCSTFESPVRFYVEGEARERASQLGPIDDDRDWELESWAIIARAALEAIREPSEGMVEAAAELEDDASHYWEDSWTGVIDHILGKETGG